LDIDGPTAGHWRTGFGGQNQETFTFVLISRRMRFYARESWLGLPAPEAIITCPTRDLSKLSSCMSVARPDYSWNYLMTKL